MKLRKPDPLRYFARIGLTLHGAGPWRSALCPFHSDSRPSLRVRPDTGAFRCMVCGAHGGDVIAFEMRRTGKDFKSTARALGAWR